MTYEQYNSRANEIDAWARAQYEAGKLSEDQIERRVERMYDELDAAYCPGRHVPDLYQSRSDVDAEPDNYPGWHAMQAAARDVW
jgi:hypothetical protein